MISLLGLPGPAPLESWLTGHSLVRLEQAHAGRPDASNTMCHSNLVPFVEQVLNPLTKPEREVMFQMLLPKGAHRIYRMALAFSFFPGRSRFFLGNRFQGAFDDLLGRPADSTGEGGLDDLLAMRGEVDLHGGSIARAR